MPGGHDPAGWRSHSGRGGLQHMGIEPTRCCVQSESGTTHMSHSRLRLANACVCTQAKGCLQLRHVCVVSAMLFRNFKAPREESMQRANRCRLERLAGCSIWMRLYGYSATSRALRPTPACATRTDKWREEPARFRLAALAPARMWRQSSAHRPTTPLSVFGR